MLKITGVYLIIFLLAGCSAYYRTTAPSDSTRLVDYAELESIPLELTTHLGDQQQFIEGDEIQFLLSLGEDAYVYMFYIDAADNIRQILPNENQQSNFYAAGYFQTIPEYENFYRFTISEPFGKESIWVFASDRLITMKKLPGSLESIKQLIKNSSEKAYGDYVLRITTLKNGKR